MLSATPLLLSLKMKKICQLTMMTAVLFLLAGCSTIGLNNPFDKAPKLDEGVIAANLVNSLTQLDHLNPETTRIQISRPKDGFSRKVRDEFRALGYELERVSGKEGMNRIQTDLKQVNTETGSQSVYIVSVGPVSVERAFDVIDGQTIPMSEQVIRGTNAQAIALNDSMFTTQNEELAAVSFRPYEGPKIDDVIAAPKPKSRAAAFFSRSKQNAVKKNLYETLTSNYKDVFAGYVDVDQSVLIFPNDSLRLGDINKEIIEHYVSQMNPETDLLSIIGCSHGETRINNGNSLLAIGRANRVKEALLFSGLEHDQILEEGCWAPVTFDEVMPRRGVVLTLKRQKNS